MKFSKNLKELRKIYDFTQKELAEKLNVNQSAISDWENDITKPEYESLIKLADIFDVTLDDLVGR